LRVREGDSLVIPRGTIRISLDPSVGGKLFRSGIPFILGQLFYSSRPDSSSDLLDFASRYKDISNAIVEKSPMFDGLDLEDAADADEAWTRAEEHKMSREWHAILMGTFARLLEDALTENDAAKAGWAAYNAATAHALVVALEPTFEQTLWRGYLANQVVYESVEAAATTPAEAEAIRHLQRTFEALDEATLHTWVGDGRPIGPRLGVQHLPEETLNALAKFHLTSFERKREQERFEIDRHRQRQALRVQWAGWTVAALTALFTIGMRIFST
jgi:hypothetical protein